MYTLAYRNLGIFQENIVNRFLQDVVKSCQPGRPPRSSAISRPRGGISTKVTATYRAPKASAHIVAFTAYSVDSGPPCIVRQASFIGNPSEAWSV